MAPKEPRAFPDVRFPAVHERILTLLEDFDVVGTQSDLVLMCAGPHRDRLRTNLRAALVASTLRLSSLDHARAKYCDSESDAGSDEGVDPLTAYTRAFREAKLYLKRLQDKLTVDDRPDPPLGVYGASIVIERLRQSFSSAHLMYRLGHRYEGHAVSKVILEQICWAYAACSLETIAAIDALVTTRTIGTLKKLAPWVGELYGFLSRKTHVSYKSHSEFIKIVDGRACIVLTQWELIEYSSILLQLADLCGIVWEYSQRAYIDELETIMRSGDRFVLNPERPFLATVQRALADVELAMTQVAPG